MNAKTKNRVLSFATAVMMMLSMLIILPKDIAIAAGGTLLGDGTSESPYQISDADDLYAFAEKVNNGENDICAVLTSDIVINENVLDENGNLNDDGSGLRQWAPIANESNSYIGSFDGQDHIISGLYLNSSEKYVGLFRYIGEKGTVENVGLSDNYINNSSNSSDDSAYAGGIAGYNDGTITNCYNAGTLGGSGIYASPGSIAGRNYGTISNCYNAGTISGNYDAGGIVSYNEGTVANCYNTGTISGSDNAGGIVSYNEGTISNCYNTGTVSGTGYTGGITGYNYKGTISSCYSTGIISGNYDAGGITGLNNGTTANCYYLADSETDEFDGTTFKTAEQFASGEVAYLLQGEQETQICGQDLSDKNSLPDLNGAKIYYGYESCIDNAEKIYSNTELDDTKSHKYVNGICSACGEYEPAVLNDGVYEISNAGQLYWFADFANQGGDNLSANAKLMKDIVINENVLDENGQLNGDGLDFRQWTPIGKNDSNQYKGIFDGQNHTISGLYINSEAQYVGLFGCIGSDAEIKNVGIIDNYINSSYGFAFVSGIVSRSYDGTISNCYNTGTVSGTEYACGILGYNLGTIINCYNTGTVSGAEYIGSILVENNGKISNCFYLDDNETDKLDGTAFKTTKQFASGEVTYLLQQGQEDQTAQVWGQLIGTDEFPQLTFENHVYYASRKTQDNVILERFYTNKENADILVQVEYDENGFNDEYNVYQPAVLNGGVYEISNAGQLYWFADYVGESEEHLSANAKLMKDIIINENVLDKNGNLNGNGSNFRKWTPIGNEDDTYTGRFDGDNHTISGLYIDSSEEYSGLFRSIGEKGTVENVGLIDNYMSGKFVGGIADENIGTIENCYNTGTIKAEFAGGIASYNIKGKITDCHYTGTISAEFAGGIAGYNMSGTIENCYNTGTMNADYAGGIAVTSEGDIINCYNIGKVNGTEYAGGIAGGNAGTIQNCYNTGEISEAEYAGGIAGGGEGTLTNCYYLAKSETDEFDGTTFKTAEQFASGEVAYLLQGEQETQIWGQDLSDKNSLPALNGAKIYYGYADCGDSSEKVYSNKELSDTKLDHKYVNGICTDCGEYEPAKLNKDGIYEIENAGQLYWFADFANQGGDNLSANAKLMKDIVINENVLDKDGNLNGDGSAFRQWTPIGKNDSNQYKGIFDGQNHTISGLYINDNENLNVGLFGDIDESGIVENIGVIDSYISSSANISGRYVCVGGISGYNYGTITNCYNTGAVSGSDDVGGISDYNSGNAISNCYYLADGESDGINGTTFKTAEQFASGEVTYLLQQGQEDQTAQVWGQLIGTDKFPQLTSENRVYYATQKTQDNIILKEFYTNTEGDILVQVEYDENGFNDEYNVYQPAVLNGGVYEISNAGQLYWFAEYVNESEENISANAKLMKDIVINENVLDKDGNLNGDGSDFREWVPIDLYDGTFDGQDHTISGLYINNSEIGYAGLFGYIYESGTVENVGLIDNYINGVSVGGIAFYNYGTISSCYNAGTISGLGEYTESGGIACNNCGTISSCYNTGKISGEYVSGIACDNFGTITNCYNKGIINAKIASGIANANYSLYGNTGTIENCYNTGEISEAEYSGSIVGQNGDDTNYGTITDCYYLADSETDEEDGTTFKTKEQFESGEVAYLLQGDNETTPWGQDLDKESSPTLNGDTVYYSENGCHGYSNMENGYVEHTLDADGTHCIVCGKKKAAIELTENTFTYNGKAIDTADIVTSDSDGEMSFVWKSGEDILDSAPINADEYKLIVSITETEEYIKDKVEYDIEIVQAEPTVENVTASIPDNTLDADKVTLKATTSVDGTLKLKDNTEIQPGTHEYEWIFTPDDAQNYKSVEGKVTIIANIVTTTTTTTTTIATTTTTTTSKPTTTTTSTSGTKSTATTTATTTTTSLTKATTTTNTTISSTVKTTTSTSASTTNETTTTTSTIVTTSESTKLETTTTTNTTTIESTTTTTTTGSTTTTISTTTTTSSGTTTTETEPKPNETIIQFEYEEVKSYFSHDNTEFNAEDLFKSITMVETDENGVPIEDTRVDIMNDVHFGGESPSSIFKSESGYMITTVQAYYGENAIDGALPTVAIGLKGDVNLNGYIDVNDAVCTLSYYARKSANLNPVFSDDEIMNNLIYMLADVDGNEKISVSDATKILEFYAKHAAGLEVEW